MLGMVVLARDEFTAVMSVGARTILVGEGIMSVSSDSDMTILPALQGLNRGSYAHRRPPPYRNHEYFFQVHSGTKLPTRITMKASQNRFQSNETTESTFNAPTTAKSGNAIPSIL